MIVSDTHFRIPYFETKLHQVVLNPISLKKATELYIKHCTPDVRNRTLLSMRLIVDV